MFSGADRKFYGQNPPAGAQIYYSLGGKAESVSLKVMDYTGKQMAELQTETEPGLHVVAWNLGQGRRGGRRGGAGGPATAPQGGRGAVAARPPAAAAAGEADVPQVPAFLGGGFGQQAKPGVYRVVLSVDGKEP